MIEIFIFYLHIIGSLYAFTKNWQNKGISEGFLSIGVIALFFTIGWALTGTIARLIYNDNMNIYFNTDTLSLIILVIPESIFYYYFFIKDKN